jgi:hypothetical protein
MTWLREVAALAVVTAAMFGVFDLEDRIEKRRNSE